LFSRSKRTAVGRPAGVSTPNFPSSVPLLIGVGLLFWNGRSLAGWVLTIAGALFILAGVLANMHIYFRPTSLFNTLVMLILFVGGFGLIARALSPRTKKSTE
jgi:hypothetical protein